MRSKFRADPDIEVHVDRTIRPLGPCPDPVLELVYNGGKYAPMLLDSGKVLPEFSTDRPSYYQDGQRCGAD